MAESLDQSRILTQCTITTTLLLYHHMSWAGYSIMQAGQYLYYSWQEWPLLDIAHSMLWLLCMHALLCWCWTGISCSLNIVLQCAALNIFQYCTFQMWQKWVIMAVTWRWITTSIHDWRDGWMDGCSAGGPLRLMLSVQVNKYCILWC